MILRFRLLPQRYAIARLSATAAIPEWAARGAFFSITRTAEELSIICDEDAVPADCTAARGWRCLSLAGPFAFTEIGIAAEFTSLLAKSGIGVLVVSTYDTDCVLVPGVDVDRATAALSAAGHRIER